MKTAEEEIWKDVDEKDQQLSEKNNEIGRPGHDSSISLIESHKKQDQLLKEMATVLESAIEWDGHDEYEVEALWLKRAEQTLSKYRQTCK